jgi:hypothetical protein
LQAATDASNRISALEQKPTFSAGVRTAQIRLAQNEIRYVLRDLFSNLTPIIEDGQRSQSVSAIDAITESDRAYLEAAFSSTGDVASYIKSQRTSAMLNVTNAVRRVTQVDIPLSGRVYRTQSLANRWVQNVIVSHLARGSSAKDLAKAVRSNILPNTSGGVSYAALRLGRTELNNAYHATAIDAAQDRPWIIGMGWYLSATHTTDPAKPEICEQLAKHVYDVDSVPAKPHPQCRCYVAPKMESLPVFMSNLTTGKYKDWIDNATQAA